MISAPAQRRVLRPVLVPLGALVAVYVGLSRAYRGMHYLSDVVAGWLLGSLCLLLAVATVREAFRATPTTSAAARPTSERLPPHGRTFETERRRRLRW